MTELDDWPGGSGTRTFDTAVPNVARIYDFLLKGKDNYAADRDAARNLLKAVPGAMRAAQDNRRFLQRAVQFLAAEAGIRQFIDIGTGLPTRGSVHQVAQAADPMSRVVYADNDPVVVAHARALLADSSRVTAVNADLRNPGHLLTLPAVRSLIDSDEPVAILMVAVLHFVADSEDPWSIVHAYKASMPPGSYLAVSHVTGDDTPADAIRQAAEVYEHASAPGLARSPRADCPVLPWPGYGPARTGRPGMLALARPGKKAPAGPFLCRYRP